MLNQVNKVKSRLPSKFKYENKEITDTQEIPNTFNKYFTDVGPSLASKISQSTKSFKSFLNGSHLDSFFVPPVTEAQVEQELHKLNPEKSAGVDDVSPKVISQVASTIKKPFTSILIKSFSTGIIPVKLKISAVTPIYKSEDESLFSNYRPVAVLPCFSKVLEKLMYKQLTGYIEKQRYYMTNSTDFGKATQRKWH